MPSDRRWSDADRELVAGALGNVMLWVRTNATWRSPERAAELVLDALTAAGKLLPDHDARVRADERAQVAEEIAQAIEATARTSYQTRGPAYRDAAAIARTHAITPATGGDPDAT